MRTVVACVGALLAGLLTAPLLVLVAPVWIVSAGTRALARLFEPAYLTHEQLIEFDPTFGWRPRAHLDTHHLMADVFQISTDAQGWRGRTSLAESEVVVFGDSFAAGYGIGDDQLFANLSAQPRIKPIGVGGYSMVQELLWMKELVSDLAGKIVVWFIFLGNDLYDNLTPDLHGYRKPFVRETRDPAGWEIVRGHVSRDRWPIISRIRKDHIHMAKLAELCAGTFLADRAYRACEFLIRQGKQVCGEAGADLVVLTIPDPHQLSPAGRRYLQSIAPPRHSVDVNLPDRKIDVICQSVGVPFIAGSAFLDVTCYKKNDCHWNARGHRKVAKLLAEIHASRREPPVGQEDELARAAILSCELNPAPKSTS